MAVLHDTVVFDQREELWYCSRIDKVVQQYYICIASAGSLCRATVDEQPDLNLAPPAISQGAYLRMSNPSQRGESDMSLIIGKHT